jgi:hypothetical protein
VTSTLVGGYLVVLALALAIAPLGALIGHAKWVTTLVPGLICGALHRPTVREAAISSGVLALLMSVGWTGFSALSGKLDAAAVLWLLVASVPVMLVAASSAFVGLLVGARARPKPTAG